jgi:hypothetical protein
VSRKAAPVSTALYWLRSMEYLQYSVGGTVEAVRHGSSTMSGKITIVDCCAATALANGCLTHCINGAHPNTLAAFALPLDNPANPPLPAELQRRALYEARVEAHHLLGRLAPGGKPPFQVRAGHHDVVIQGHHSPTYVQRWELLLRKQGGVPRECQDLATGCSQQRSKLLPACLPKPPRTCFG